MVNQIIGRNGPICLLLLVTILLGTEARHCEAPQRKQNHWNLLTVSTGVSADSSVASHRKVSGGYAAVQADFPSFATLKAQYANGSAYGCSGVILGKRTVLTAAHCIDGRDVRKVWVHPGVRGQDDWLEENTYIGNKLCLSEGYKVEASGQNKFDYAVIKLDREMKFDQLAMVNWPQRRLVATDQAYIVGAGITMDNGKDAKTAQVLPVKSTTCHEFDHNSTTCFEWSQKEHQGEPCEGDSGGPVYAKIDGKLELFGLISQSFGCRTTGAEFALYVDVYNQKDNILELEKKCLA